jgi:hypothetical protein
VIYQSNKDFSKDASAPQRVSSTFGLTPQDTSAWFSLTRWAIDHHIEQEVLQKIVTTLQDLNLSGSAAAADTLYENIFRN